MGRDEKMSRRMTLTTLLMEYERAERDLRIQAENALLLADKYAERAARVRAEREAL